MGQRNFVAVCVYLIRFNVELDEVSSTETRRDSNTGCVPGRSHQNSTEAGNCAVHQGRSTGRQEKPDTRR
jgi:hypothetical protein